MKDPDIPFNKAFFHPTAEKYLKEALNSGHLTSGMFTERCEQWFEEKYHIPKGILTFTGTHGLHLATVLCGLGPGMEVIMPSFTFVTAAQMVVMSGATPVFVDIDERDCNMDPQSLDEAVTSRTRAVMPLHYAGVPCRMDEITTITQTRGIDIIEDAAHAVLAQHNGKFLGTFGRFGFVSFHETKNLSSGEGGMLCVNNPEDIARAEVVRDKGTNRKAFGQGLADKYTWKDLGMSYRASEVSAALLFSQLEIAEDILSRRREIWRRYSEALRDVAAQYEVCLSRHVANAHIFYCVFRSRAIRDRFISSMDSRGINCVFHYSALHESPMGQRYGRISGDLSHTAHVSRCLVRLPLWVGLEEIQDRVIDAAILAMHEAHAES